MPFVVANEYICGRLGQLIGLPVPPGVVVPGPAGQLTYVSLRFGDQGQLPPPIIPQDLAADDPNEASGIVAFDCWIRNPDRHPGNLAYARGLLPLTVFDHSHALLGVPETPPGALTPDRSTSVERLRNTLHEPMVLGCLPGQLTTAAHLDYWGERIGRVDDDMITSICQAMVVQGGLSFAEASAVEDFLLQRKGRIIEMLKASAACMPNVTDWTTI